MFAKSSRFKRLQFMWKFYGRFFVLLITLWNVIICGHYYWMCFLLWRLWLLHEWVFNWIWYNALHLSSFISQSNQVFQYFTVIFKKEFWHIFCIIVRGREVSKKVPLKNNGFLNFYVIITISQKIPWNGNYSIKTVIFSKRAVISVIFTL